MESLGIEREPGVDDARVLCRQGVQFAEVAGSDGHAAAVGQPAEYGAGQSGAFQRIGGTTDLVDQAERVGLRLLEDHLDVAQVGGERGE